MKEEPVHIIVIVCLGTLFYLNSSHNFFVWNDWTLIVENFLIEDWRHLPEVLASAFWKPLTGEPPQIYRPIVFASFMADFALWGLNPFGYHLTNTSLHVVNSVLVYFFSRIYVSSSTALMAAILFAVHPIHTEAVTYISGRADPLMFFFLLGGVLLFLQSEKRRSRLLYIASLPLFFFSLLAKEVAAIFPLLLFVADLTAFPSVWKANSLRRLMRQFGPLVVLALYLFLKKAFVGMTISGGALTAAEFAHRVLLILQAIPLYLGLLIYPLNLRFLHGVHPYTSFFDGLFLLAVFLLLGAVYGLRYAIISGSQAVVISLAWFFIGLLSLFHYANFNLPFFEAWIYLPSLGFFLLVALCLSRLQDWTRSRVPVWIALFIAVLLGSITLNRNRDWKDEMQVSLHTITASPDSPVALRLAGNAHFRHARTDMAEKIFQRALLLAPEDPMLHESLGRLDSFFGKDSEALSRYQRMRELTPENPYLYWLIGRYYLRRGDYANAEKYFAEGVALFPFSSELHNDLARVYYLQGKLEAAHAALNAALKISPYSPLLRGNLDRLLQQKPS